jgi:hypothetical protein
VSYHRGMSVVSAVPTVSLAGLLAVVVGCTGALGDEFDAPAEEVPCAFVEGVVDAGFCPAELAADGDLDGGDPSTPRGDACPGLLLATCGVNNECAEDPGCVAADLLVRFEPERCPEAAADPRSFPVCALGNCEVLASRVCGGDAPAACEDAPACGPARELQRRADDGDASADASCAQALADETLFPACL